MLKNYQATYAQLKLVKKEEDRAALAKALIDADYHTEIVNNEYLCQCMSQAIPAITFPEGWQIKFVYPYNAAVRFLCNGISVYLDMVSENGHKSGPYWEVYLDDDDDCIRISMLNTTALIEILGK